MIVDQSTDYYPYGLSFENHNLNRNRYLYIGKELQDQSINGKMLQLYDFGSRNYDPILGRWFNIDPALQFTNPYLYCGNSPMMYIDPDGEDALLIVIPSYQARLTESDDSRVPLTGHTGLLLIDSKGNTKYYEYGRYGTEYGRVRNVKVADVDMENGMPTLESLHKTLQGISGAYDNEPVEAKYIKTDKDAEMIDWMKKRIADPTLVGEYGLFIGPNCTTVANDALDLEEGVERFPGSPHPTLNLWSYDSKHPSISSDKKGTKLKDKRNNTIKNYDRKTGKTTIDKDPKWWQFWY